MLIVHLFVNYAHVNLCHFFSSSCCRGLAAASACVSSWTFLFTFFPPKSILNLVDSSVLEIMTIPFVIVSLLMILESKHDTTNKLTLAPSEDSDQTRHPG